MAQYVIDKSFSFHFSSCLAKLQHDLPQDLVDEHVHQVFPRHRTCIAVLDSLECLFELNDFLSFSGLKKVTLQNMS